MNETVEKLYKYALKGYNNAFATYSKFKVGASVLLKNGEVIYGCNVENSSFGLSNCAERTTLFKAVSVGYKKDDFVAFLIIANTSKPVSPCGACRQVMSELLNPKTPVYLTNLNKDIYETTVEGLLPYMFTGDVFNE